MDRDSQWTVMCILFMGNEVLMMKRTKEPLAWGPPAGHLKIGESYEAGIYREVLEETGLACDPIMPVDVWQGIHRGRRVTNVTFVCEVDSLKVVLSEEHSEFEWVPIDQLKEWQDKTHLNLKPWPFYVQTAKTYKNDYREDF